MRWLWPECELGEGFGNPNFHPPCVSGRIVPYYSHTKQRDMQTLKVTTTAGILLVGFPIALQMLFVAMSNPALLVVALVGYLYFTNR